MKKKSPPAKKPVRKSTAKRSPAKKTATRTKATPRAAKKASGPSLAQRMAEARKLEKRDSKQPLARAAAAFAARSTPLRNPGFPNTYIKQISVALDDPNHPMTLTWTGPQAAAQETGPFRTSPGAGVRGINCDATATSRRSGTKCTPKGTYAVEGFQSALNSDSRATYVTWFQQWRGIALHYFPSVPRYAASHGCVRIEEKRVAQLVQSNSRVDLTKVVISGTWTKPPKQW